jgi:CheY-like chemotaxis protein/HAMP domain-containing protein/putative methionine-R-sulfoxide reductase with GAF domain
MKIKTKLILVPVLAAFTYLIIFTVNTILGSRNSDLLVSIEKGYLPALEMSRGLEDILGTIQRKIEYAAATQDDKVLGETDILRDRFLVLLDNNKDNPVLRKGELDSLQILFRRYYPLARQTTIRMIGEGLKDDVLQNLQAMQQDYNLIREKLSTTSAREKTGMSESVANAQNNQQNILLTIIIVTLLSLIVQILISVFFTRSITVPLQTIVKAAGDLARGNVQVDLDILSRDEVGELAKATSMLVETSKNLTRAADAIGQGDYKIDVQVRSDQDILSNAIIRMKNNLLRMTEENARQNWHEAGQAELSNKIRGDQNTAELAQNVINYLATYLQSQVGAIYLQDDDDILRLYASYAYKKRKNVANEFKVGEGLVGQAALEKKSILITEVPDDYITINSGLGESKPLNILVTPLIYDGRVSGVIELGSFYEFFDQHFYFMEQAAESIAIALQSALARVRVKQLLEKTQLQARELQAQQEELKATNEEMQSQQEELRVANEELEEQTQALKQSEEMLKKQQEELKSSNIELEKKTKILQAHQHEIEQKNLALEKARREIEKKARELETSSEYKSEFLANMSHELRTPLNSIQILSRLLYENKERTLTDKQSNFARTIHSSGSDLLNLINEILDLSKIEAGKMALNLEQMPLSLLPAYVQQNFEHLTQEKGIYLKVEMGEYLPIDIVTDRQRVEQIMKNLLSNAIKFTEQGGITVKIGRPAEGTNFKQSGLNAQQTIAIEVHDTGIGIPADKKELIFQAFQQVEGTSNRKYGGTGLGLSISLELTRLLGGEIRVESELGKGSIFTLYLPQETRSEWAGSEVSEQKNDTPVSTVTPGVPVPLKRVNEIRDDRLDINENDRSMLIIEDDANFAKLLFVIAREKGFKCLLAEDGEAGLQLANQYKPSAIILDVGLPRMNGWTVMSRLKSIPETRHIPVYFISGHDTRMKALHMGAIGFLGKPVTLDGLNNAFEKINKMLSKDIKKLLIVEDDKIMCDNMVELIGNTDVLITTASKGKEAIRLLSRGDFDCMVLDLGLADISGFDLIEKIHKQGNISDLPIIIYTGKELSKKEESRLRKHADSIIIKGVKSTDRLLDEVSLFLHRGDTEQQERKQEKERAKHSEKKIFKGKKILIVDDDVRNIFALSSVLEEKEMEIVNAENGIEALELLEKQNHLDLILMDIMMPEMDGYETIRRIRQQSKYTKIPIIALTAKAMKGDRQKCIDSGASDYLSKPVDMEKLLSLLQVWLYR